jgi:hypothetical protein
MPVPDYGAAPLAKTFVLVRVLSLISMIAIVGMTSNFVAQIVASHISPPREIVATLSIVRTLPIQVTPWTLQLTPPKTSLATLYSLLTLPLFYAHANLSLLIMSITDALLLLAFCIISIILGRDLSFLSCPAIPTGSSTRSAAAFAQALAADRPVNLGNWAAGDRVTCFEMKAIWGLGMALSVLFAVSTFVLPVVWVKARRAAGGGKSVA